MGLWPHVWIDYFNTNLLIEKYLIKDSTYWFLGSILNTHLILTASL